VLVRIRAQVQALLWDLSATGPVELTEGQLRDAIAIMGERHEHGAQAAESALEWLGWEREGTLLLRRSDEQFAWYTLPRKLLTGLQDKRETGELVALTLDHLGDIARGYAEVCRSPATDELLRASELEDPTAGHRFHQLMEASGIEPPDTDLLAWGRVMGSIAPRRGARPARTGTRRHPPALRTAAPHRRHFRVSSRCATPAAPPP
jgi:hypothetical protein